MSDIIDPNEGPKPTKDEFLASMLNNLVQAQAKESEVKKQELDVRSQEIASNERIALRSIEAQEKSHTDGHSQYNKHLIHRYVFNILLLLIIVLFAGYLFANGGQELVIECLKLLVSLAIGAFGGFYAGKNKKNEDE